MSMDDLEHLKVHEGKIRTIYRVPDQRWTPETEELVARTWLASVDTGGERLTLENVLPASRQAYLEIARSALTALADAGVLLPVGGKTRQEYGVRSRLNGEKWTPVLPASSPELAAAFAEQRVDRGGFDEAQVMIRTVARSSWREVTE